MFGQGDPFVDDRKRLRHDSSGVANIIHLPQAWEAQKGTDDTVSGGQSDFALATRRQTGLCQTNHLRKEISRVLKANPIGLNPEGTYMPDEELDRLLTAETVQDALGGVINPKLVTFILQGARKCFALLQLVFTECDRRRQAMEGFHSTNFGDDILNQTKYGRDSKALRLCQPQCTNLEPHCRHHFPADMPWDTTELDTFSEKRWHFLVPVFKAEQFVYEINSHQYLPFTKKDSAEGPSDGHFSEVFCVRMLAKHQTKIETKEHTIRVALKSLRQITEPRYDIEKEWRREAKAYEQLDDTNRQIIRGIAAIRQKAKHHHNDSYHLLLEWADGGSLHSFWESHRGPQVGTDIERSRGHVLEMLKQLYGLADALEYMHTSSRSSGRSQCSSPQRIQEHFYSEFDYVAELGHGSMLQVPAISLHVADFRTYLREPDDIQEHGGQLPALSITSPEDDESVASPDHRLTTPTEENWRHGDIKTENILRFKGGMEDAWLGTLKLADLGRAQQHALKTELRTTKEKEPWRTIWYEPPDLIDEVHAQAHGKISRLFDIWSMGCVIFETVLWLLYGTDSIDEFLRANDLASGEQAATPYWRKQDGDGYKVSSTASLWMDNILQTDPEREGAIGDLIKLVKDRLLKINLPRNSEIYSAGFRTNASDLREQIQQIIDRATENQNYLFSGNDRTLALPPKAQKSGRAPASTSSTGASLSPRDVEDRGPRKRQGRATTIAQQRVYTNTLKDAWVTCDDASFVNAILRDRRFSKSDSEDCDFCEGIDILSEELSFAVDLLKTNAEEDECDLCELVHSTLRSTNIPETNHINLERSDDSFMLQGTDKKLLRLCRVPTSASSAHKDIPIGAPVLLSPPSELNSNCDDGFVKLLRAWVQTCDENHLHSCETNIEQAKLPKRLINVEGRS